MFSLLDRFQILAILKAFIYMTEYLITKETIFYRLFMVIVLPVEVWLLAIGTQTGSSDTRSKYGLGTAERVRDETYVAFKRFRISECLTKH